MARPRLDALQPLHIRERHQPIEAVRKGLSPERRATGSDSVPPGPRCCWPGDTLPPARGSATSTSAAMPGVLLLRLRFRAGAAVQPTRHHRFLFTSTAALVSVNGVVAIAEQPKRRFAAGAAHTWTRSPCLDSAARPCRVQHRPSPPALDIALASARGLLATRRNLKKQRTSTGHEYAASARGRTRTRGARSSRARPSMAEYSNCQRTRHHRFENHAGQWNRRGTPLPHASEENTVGASQVLVSALWRRRWCRLANALPWNRHR